MKDKLIKALISIIIFEIYYLFPYILNYIMEIANINLANYSRTTIMIILYTLELIPLIFMIFIYKKDLKDEIIIFKKNFIKNIDKYIRLWIFALFLMSASNIIISHITWNTVSNNEEAVRTITDILPIYSLITSCIFAPIVEELAYRKTIGNIFDNKKLAIIMSGIIFGLAHVIGTYSRIVDLLYIIPYGIFGSIFMYIYLESKNIYTTMTIHCLHNTILLIMYFIR